MISTAYVDPRFFFRAILEREANQEEMARIEERLKKASAFQILHEFLASAEYTRTGLEQAMDLHLLFIHAVRLKLVSMVLPKATTIVDLGGANGNLHDMGYPYPFRELIAVDLPNDDRCEMYRGIKMESRVLSHGKISVLYSSMVDLSAIASSSVDLVWMGQAIEHITEEESFTVYREVRRILEPGGYFCLDTPNRILTEIHTGGGLIHPEHKLEYRPAHLKKNLTKAGFTIVDELGLCEMVQSSRSKRFDYRDFFTGSGINTNIEGSYIQYYCCQTPIV
jgi:SAM-dependent methyltransferase